MVKLPKGKPKWQDVDLLKAAGKLIAVLLLAALLAAEILAAVLAAHPVLELRRSVW